MNTSLLSLPLPILAFVLSSVACALAARLDLGRKSARFAFMGFFALIAVGTLLVGLRFGYGVEDFILIQRCLPLFGGPLLYLGFALLTVPEARVRPMVLLHLGAALGIALLISLLLRGWDSLDLAVGASYLFYAVLLLRIWRKGANHFAFARLEIAPALHRWSLWGALFLALSMAWDTAIAISFALGRADSALEIISYASLMLLACLMVVIVSVSSKSNAPKGSSAEAPDDASDIERSARTLLEETELYLDTELSLERLAKRLHLPARSLSAAINSTRGMNVSQYVNGFRVAHAARLLRESDLSVTKVAEQSGFLTRSNFYREFQRVHGTSPAQYREMSC